MTVEEEKKPVEEKKTLTFDEDSETRLMRFMQVLDGVNPDAAQSMNDFLDMKNLVERSNLSLRRDVQLIVYLDMCSEAYFPTIERNPFAKWRDSLARAFLAKGGWKSEQFVELMRNQVDLSGYEVTREEVKHSFVDRILGRDKAK